MPPERSETSAAPPSVDLRELTPAEFLTALDDWPHTVTRFADGGRGAPDKLWALSSPEQLPALLARNARRALYFNPARPTAAALDSIRKGQLLKLAYRKRRDIAAARVLWADVDPPAAVKAAPAALAEWRAAMPARLASFGAHLLVDSGRGFWLFWLLEPPLQCGNDGRDGDPLLAWLEAAADHVKSEIEGVDSVANPDRVARLPGSVNAKTGNVARAFLLQEGRAALDDLPFAPPPPQEAPRVAPRGRRKPDRFGATDVGAQLELQRLRDQAAAAPAGERNATLNKAALQAFGYVKAGRADRELVHSEFRDAALHAAAAAPDGDPPEQIDATLRSAWDAAQPKQPKQRRQSDQQQERQAAISAAADQLRSPKLAYLDGAFWRRNGTASWGRVNDDALYSEVGTALSDAAAELRPADDPRWASTRAAHAETLHLLRVEATAPSVWRLPPADLLLPHNLDTGERVAGAPARNLTLEIRADGEIVTRPHEDRDFYQSTLPYDWSGPAADPPPRFGAFLHQTFEGAADADARALLLCELLGATLTGASDTQVVPLLRGAGRAGAGVCLRLLRDLLGGPSRVESLESPARLAASRFAAAALVGKAALLLPDLPKPPKRGLLRDQYFAGVNVIKSISGEDPIPVERKGGATVSVRLPLIVWAASNFPVRWIQGAEDSQSWGERLLPLRFDNSLPAPARIRNYERDVLGAELERIAAYAIGCFAAAVERGGGAVSWTRPPSSAALLAEMVGGADARIYEFCERRIVGREGAWTARPALRAAMANDWGAPVNDQQAAALYDWAQRELGATEGGRKGVRGFRGIALLDVAEVCPECAAPAGDHADDCTADPRPFE